MLKNLVHAPHFEKQGTQTSGQNIEYYQPKFKDEFSFKTNYLNTLGNEDAQVQNKIYFEVYFYTELNKILG